MEGVVGGSGRNAEIAEVYGSFLSETGKQTALISESDWDRSGSLDVLADERTTLLGEDHKAPSTSTKSSYVSFLAEIPAVVVTLMINFMAAIPFGVAYFPLGWTSGDGEDDPGAEDDSSGVSGPFPLPGKEVLGIRMYLFACITGQIALAIASRFGSPVAAQLIENVPFYHAMASIVVAEQGYGMEALSTLFLLFGLSSILTGLMFYALGKAGMGKVVYYFPSHVLMGFIGGIGVFIAIASTGIMTGQEFKFTNEGVANFAANFGKFAPALYFEIGLRILMFVLKDKDGKPLFDLLAPIYFISIVPMFYIALKVLGISMEKATEEGYFFPAASSSESEEGVEPSVWQDIFDGHILDMFRIINFRTVSSTAVAKSLGTVVGVSCFSVINVPINIPAFANACDVDVDMNSELIAHGYSNVLTGLFGGIQNVMTYSVSVLFYNSGGRTKTAQMALVVGMVIIFVFGMSTMPYIPKCMAGTLLLHIGVDLFKEGVYDSFEEYDKIEYGGVLVITVVMTFMGMTPALIAGIIVAMTTYALQSVQNLNPIFSITNAATLKSSAWTRPPDAMAVLNSSTSGRSRIMVIQLQANIFFGNAVDMSDAIKAAVAKNKPIIVIIDFTLVVSMDTSAAQAVNKLKNALTKNYKVKTNIFVMGSNRKYFPCEYGLSRAILAEGGPINDEENGSANVLDKIPKNQVCSDFDEALIFAEDILITSEDPTLLKLEHALTHDLEQKSNTGLTQEEEKRLATHYIQNLIFPDSSKDEQRDALQFFSYLEREVYSKDELVWNQGDTSGCAKLVLSGNLVASMPASNVREEIPRGVVIGELGLINGVDRLTSVICESETSVVYNLSKTNWERMIRDDPAVACILHHIAIRYLSYRVQHVSNRIIETRCLPV